jgi:hypothetical protein
MNTKPLPAEGLTEYAVEPGNVSPEVLRTRAAELAVINGRLPQDITKADLRQARRELSGGSDVDPADVILEGAPESERWDPVHGSTGEKILVPVNEDEDAEGRSTADQLVAAGVAAAEHQQMLQATRAADKKDL